jgi:hypothetical protein
MSVRKRIWGAGDAKRERWVVDFFDAGGHRRLKTFAKKTDAERFQTAVRAIGSGVVPEPLTRGYRPIEFDAPLPEGNWRNGPGRDSIAEAARRAHPNLVPTTEAVIVHVDAEMPPRSVVADVDNLLKPILDALKGIAWMDDVQVTELTARRIPSRRRRLKIKIWQMPGPIIEKFWDALNQAGLIVAPR